MPPQDFVAGWAEARRHLEAALPEVSKLMERKFAEVDGRPEPGSNLDQCGLKDGAEVIGDHMANDEWGLALEHLCYMVKEADLSISAEVRASIKAAGQALQL